MISFCFDLVVAGLRISRLSAGGDRVVDERYADRSHTYEAWCPAGVRARVGAWHLPLSDLLNAVIAAGLRLDCVAEVGSDGVPDVLGLAAVKPA